MRFTRETDPLPRQLVLALGLVGAGALLAVRWRADAVLGAAGCPLRRLTGVPCPTCGGTHAVVALARGDAAGALAANPLVTLAACGAAVWFAWAAAATLVPRWRVRPVVDGRGRSVVRWGLAAALAGAWIWQIVSLR